MKRFKIFVATFMVAMVGVFALAPATSVSALDPLAGACSDPSASGSQICQSKGDNASSLIKTIINTLLFIVGALSVVMIIWGGIRYTTSAGNASSVTAAKNTIVYAIVGLIVSFLAFAIVNWVIKLL